MAVEDVRNLVKELLEEVRSLETKLDEIVKPLEESSSRIPSVSGSLGGLKRLYNTIGGETWQWKT